MDEQAVAVIENIIDEFRGEHLANRSLAVLIEAALVREGALMPREVRKLRQRAKDLEASLRRLAYIAG